MVARWQRWSPTAVWWSQQGDSDALAETLERVLTDPELARTLGDQGRQRVERHFCWSVCAQQMVAQYRACIDAC